MEVVVTAGAISRAKLQSDHYHQQTNTQFFLQARCPSCRPTNSVKALNGKYHILWTCLPQAHLGIIQLCLWPLISPGYLGGGLPCLSSALWCQYPSDTILHNATKFGRITRLGRRKFRVVMFIWLELCTYCTTANAIISWCIEIQNGCPGILAAKLSVCVWVCVSFGALTLLTGKQEERPISKKNWVLVCRWWWFDWSFARLIAPVVQLSPAPPHHPLLQ